jgi:hypothetical protein
MRFIDAWSREPDVDQPAKNGRLKYLAAKSRSSIGAIVDALPSHYTKRSVRPISQRNPARW